MTNDAKPPGPNFWCERFTEIYSDCLRIPAQTSTFFRTSSTTLFLLTMVHQKLRWTIYSRRSVHDSQQWEQSKGRMKLAGRNISSLFLSQLLLFSRTLSSAPKNNCLERSCRFCPQGKCFKCYTGGNSDDIDKGIAQNVVQLLSSLSPGSSQKREYTNVTNEIPPSVYLS